LRNAESSLRRTRHGAGKPPKGKLAASHAQHHDAYRAVIDKPTLRTARLPTQIVRDSPAASRNVIKRDAACRRDRDAEDITMKVRTTLKSGLGPIIEDAG
jgi:hypothetical protein